MILDRDAEQGVTSTLAIDPDDKAAISGHRQRVEEAGCSHRTTSFNGRTELLICERCRPKVPCIRLKFTFDDATTDEFEVVARPELTLVEIFCLGGFTAGTVKQIDFA